MPSDSASAEQLFVLQPSLLNHEVAEGARAFLSLGGARRGAAEFCTVRPDKGGEGGRSKSRTEGMRKSGSPGQPAEREENASEDVWREREGEMGRRSSPLPTSLPLSLSLQAIHPPSSLYPSEAPPFLTPSLRLPHLSSRFPPVPSRLDDGSFLPSLRHRPPPSSSTSVHQGNAGLPELSEAQGTYSLSLRATRPLADTCFLPQGPMHQLH